MQTKKVTESSFDWKFTLTEHGKGSLQMKNRYFTLLTESNHLQINAAQNYMNSLLYFENEYRVRSVA